MHLHSTEKTRIAQLASSLLLGTVALLFANRANAVAPIGDDSELFVTGVAQVSYNDNIFLDQRNLTGDEILDLMPGLSYEFGKTGALTTGKIAYFEDFQEFHSKTKLDNSMAHIDSNFAYDDSKEKCNFAVDFDQEDQAEHNISNLTYLANRNVYHVSGTGEMQATENSGFGAGVVWDDTRFAHAGFTNYSSTAIPLDYYFKAEPKLDLSVGFRYRVNALGAGGVNSRDYYYNVGARGEFTPDITGEIDVGYNQQKMAGGTNFDGVGIDSRFIYSITAKSTVDFGLNDDFSYDAFGNAYRLVDPYLGFNAAVDPQLSVNGRFTYGHYNYLNYSTARHDDYYTFQAGFSYVVSANVTVNGSYSYSNNKSNLTPFTFLNNIVSVSASLRF